MNNKVEKNYEALVFYARHWELMAWLWDHWDEQGTDSVLKAAESAHLPPPVIERLQRLLDDDSQFAQHFEEIETTAGSQARLLAAEVVTEIRGLLRDLGCQCGELKRTRMQSSWENEVSLRPKGIRKDSVTLRIGATVDYLTGENGVREPRLVIWLWLKSGRNGVSEARRNPRLEPLFERPTGLHASIKQEWPYTIVLSSALFDLSDNGFGLDVNSLKAQCLAPIKDLTHDHIAALYACAAS